MNKNQPAFPCPADCINRNEPSLGMTLRQWYAGLAMQGMMARDVYDSGQATPQQRARLAFIEADAMIAESERNHDNE